MFLSVLYFGYHVIFHLKSRFVGFSADPSAAIWGFAWFTYAITQHLNIFHTYTVFHPIGLNLTRLNGMPGLNIIFIPVTLLFGPVVSYNLCAIFAPGIAAWTGYLLINEITRSKLFSFLGSYFYGFSCYMIAHSLGHPTLVAPAIIIPLLVLLFLHKINEKISSARFVMLFSFFLCLLFSFSVENFATFCFWGSISFIIAIVMFKKERARLIKTIKLLFASITLTLIIVSPYLWYFFRENNNASPGFPNSPIMFSNDLLSFVIPHSIFLITKSSFIYLTSLFSAQTIMEWNVYVGLPLLFMFFLYVKQEWKSVEGKFITILTSMFSIASLGPILHLAGVPIVHFPWGFIFTKLPLLKSALPCRLGLYMSLTLSIAVAVWLKKTSWKFEHRILLVIISVVFLIPSFNLINRPMVNTIYTPSIFSKERIVKFFSRKDNLLMFPYSYSPFMLWQAQSNFAFNLAGGYLGAPPEKYENEPMFDYLSNSKSNNITRQGLAEFILKFHITKAVMINRYNYISWRDSVKYPEDYALATNYTYMEKLILPLSKKVLHAHGVIIYIIDQKKILRIVKSKHKCFK